MDEMGWSCWLESFAGAPWKGQCQHPSPLFVRCDRCACKGFSLDFLYHSFYYSFIYTPHDSEFQPWTVSLRGWSEIQGLNGSLKFQAPKTDPSYFHEKKQSLFWVLSPTCCMAKITAFSVVFCLFSLLTLGFAMIYQIRKKLLGFRGCDETPCGLLGFSDVRSSNFITLRCLLHPNTAAS